LELTYVLLGRERRWRFRGVQHASGTNVAAHGLCTRSDFLTGQANETSFPVIRIGRYCALVGGETSEVNDFLELGDVDAINRAIELAGDEDETTYDEYWALVNELHRRGTRVILDRSLELSGAIDCWLRRLACQVLSHPGYEKGAPFVAESLPVLVKLSEDDCDCVIVAAIRAIGNMPNQSALEAVLALVEHSDFQVRVAVAMALPCDESDDCLTTDHPGIRALMRLTWDVDSDVRDWATFRLGRQVLCDGMELRACLWTRLSDSDFDTRTEALLGLARRHDSRIVPDLIEALEGEEVSRSMVEAAAILADQRLSTALEQLATRWSTDETLLEQARRRCNPDFMAQQLALLQGLLDAAEKISFHISASSEILPLGAEDWSIEFSNGHNYFEYLMERAGGAERKLST
jgi:hypothetical protein